MGTPFFAGSLGGAAPRRATSYAANFVRGEVLPCTRSTPGWHQEVDGTWLEFAADKPRVTDLGLLREAAATTAIGVPSFAGAVAPSTLPAGMQLIGGSGISTTIVGSGTEDGLPYLDFRIAGTASATMFPQVLFSSYNAAFPAAIGQDWVASVFCRVLANVTGTSQIYLNFAGVNAANAGQTGDSNAQEEARDFMGLPIANVTGPTLGRHRLHVRRTMTNAATVGTSFGLLMIVYSGSTIDITFRVACPQVERGVFPSSPIMAGGTRAADILTLPLSGLHRSLSIEADLTVLRRNNGAAAETILQIDRAADAVDNRYRIDQATSNDGLTAVWRVGAADIGTRTVNNSGGSRPLKLTLGIGFGHGEFGTGADIGRVVPSAAPVLKPDRLRLGADHTGTGGSDILIRSIKITKPKPTPERQITTNCSVPSSIETAVAANRVVREIRTRHRIGRVAASSLRLRMCGYYVEANASEIALPNAATYQASIEITGAPVPVVRLDAGAGVEVAPGAADTLIGAVTPDQFGLAEFAAGMTFYVRLRERIASGGSRPACPFSVHANATAIAHDGVTDNLMGQGALVAPGGGVQITTGTTILRPFLLTGESVEPDIAAMIIGTSIDAGASDSDGDGESGGGFWARALWATTGGPIASSNLARGSSSLQGTYSYDEKRTAVSKYFTTLAGVDVSNDFGMTGDNQINARFVVPAICREFERAGIKQAVVRTVIPRTDAGNTTPIANFETGGLERDAYNTWIKANFRSAGFEALIDTDLAVRNTTTAHLWQAATTGDGVHPNASGCAIMAAATITVVNTLPVEY